MPAPKYAAIAAELRARIEDGTYQPGERLPSLAHLRQRYHIGDRTARQALAHLATIGLATPRRRDGYYVTTTETPTDQPHHQPTPVPRARRTHAARRHRPTDAPTPGDEDLTTEIHITHEVPPADIALILNTDPEQSVTIRRRILSDAHGPLILRTSYIPTHLTTNTPLEDPTPLPDDWPTTLAHHTHRTPRTITTHTSARRPTHTDARTLHTTRAAIVLVHDETTHDHHGPIDHTRSLYHADTIRLADHYTPHHTPR